MKFIQTPVQAIKSAIELFVFSCFLADSVEQGLIVPTSFREQIRIDGGGHGLDFKGVYVDDQLKSHSRNMILMALGTAAVATNKAVETVFGKQCDPADTTPDGSARVLLYQIRCAFAHGPFIPEWTPNVTRYKHIYRVTVQVRQASGETINRTINFNPTLLMGKEFSSDDFGGLGGYMGLLNYFLAKIDGNPKGHEPYSPPAEESP